MAVSGTHQDSSSLMVNGAPREIYYIKGSIDVILERCRFYYVNDESTPALDANTRNVILTKARSTASKGLRVIAMAYGYGSVSRSSTPLPISRSGSGSGSGSRSGSRSREASPTDTNTNLVFTGFQAMMDPPRKGVADSIGLLQAGGVQVVMITGDAEETAMSIARQLGLRVGGSGHGHGQSLGGGSTDWNAGGRSDMSYCLTGKAIDQMSKAQLRERVGGVSVFARTTPRHKMAIVEAFQSRGEVVAMTGDGGTSFLTNVVNRSDMLYQSTMLLL